jgi:ABC-type dipeptide/oligopeptide/nickel transport system permease subunit
MAAVGIGAILGGLMSLTPPHGYRPYAFSWGMRVFLVVTVVAIVAALPLGALLGILAGRLRRRRRLLLVGAVVIAVPVLGLAIVGLLTPFRLNDPGFLLVVAAGLIPTTAMAFVLERWTRPAMDAAALNEPGRGVGGR